MIEKVKFAGEVVFYAGCVVVGARMMFSSAVGLMDYKNQKVVTVRKITGANGNLKRVAARG